MNQHKEAKNPTNKQNNNKQTKQKQTQNEKAAKNEKNKTQKWAPSDSILRSGRTATVLLFGQSS